MSDIMQNMNQDLPPLSTMSGLIGRKRKLSSFMDSGGEEMSDEDISSERNTTDDDSKKLSKQNHSEIEKRRREKMNMYIQELSAMVPTCSSMSSKLDKLTILRMAVQHMKTLRGASSSRKEANYKPSFLSEDELKSLILEAAEGFLFVVSCDRGRMLYVSESVLNVLNITRERLIGQSLFDILHPKDVPKVKEQLSSSDLSPRERFIDTKTGMLVKSEVAISPPQLSSGARRSFFCRMRIYSPEHAVKTEDGQQWKRLKQPADRKKYATIHCTGYLKSWPPAKVGLDKDETEVDIDGCNLSCLVAIARVQTIQSPMPSTNNNIQLKPTEFVSRHAMDGKFTFVDQRATAVMGYLPQELLGTSCYEYYHIDDISVMAENHKTVLSSREKIITSPYRFRAKNGEFILLRSRMFTFRNPWTKEIEYVVSTNTLVNKLEATSSNTDGAASKDQEPTQLQSLITNMGKAPVPGFSHNTHMGAGKIGWRIAEEVMVMEAERMNEVSSSGWESKDNSPIVVDSVGGGADNLNSTPDATQPSSSGGSDPKTARTPPLVTNKPSLPSQQQQQPSFFNSSVEQGGARSSTTSSSFAEVPSTSGSSAMAALADLGSPAAAAAAAAAKVKEMGGDDEAAMAFIMSLLEADAGLGGSVDFNDLPWPL
ncbi:protein cycle-like [Diadema setosum]|uniref:protein cycle-like n=1 Tax=Diadema setosum TaxID=31175 RepID=UPI003B3B745B